MESQTQLFIDAFYLEHGPCCAGCDWWKFYNSLVGDCTKSAPVSGTERGSMLGLEYTTLKPDAGHIMTRRDHMCGDFIDTYVW